MPLKLRPPADSGMVMPPIRRVADPLFVISTLPDSFALKAPFPVSASADTEMRPAPAVKEPIVMTWAVLSLVSIPTILPSFLEILVMTSCATRIPAMRSISLL
ncbi:hypothetical protein GCM10008965_16590 [Methylorubrum aminovorans]